MELPFSFESRIYEITLQRLSSKAGQTVFVDDRKDYIRGAKEVGLNTILFKSINQVKDELVGLGVERININGEGINDAIF